VSKELGSALKAILKASGAAEKCASSGGGGGGGAAVTATISGAGSANFATIASVPPHFSFYTNNMGLPFIAGSPVLGGTGIGFSVDNVTTNGTYDLLSSGNINTGATDLNQLGEWIFGAGSVTFTTVDIPGQHMVGTFNFIASQPIIGSGSV